MYICVRWWQCVSLQYDRNYRIFVLYRLSFINTASIQQDNIDVIEYYCYRVYQQWARGNLYISYIVRYNDSIKYKCCVNSGDRINKYSNPRLYYILSNIYYITYIIFCFCFCIRVDETVVFQVSVYNTPHFLQGHIFSVLSGTPDPYQHAYDVTGLVLGTEVT